MNRSVVKHKETGSLYEVDYIVHDRGGVDVFSGHRLSNYDGMPIGDRVWMAANQFDVHERFCPLRVKEA